VTIGVRQSLRVAGRVVPADVRAGRVAITLVLSVGFILLLLHVPPFMAAGADLTDRGQRTYATNIWQETQTSLALIAVALPWLIYALLWQGAAWGRRVLLLVATAGVVVSTWLALLSIQSYAALPRPVSGLVDHVQGRALVLQGGRAFYLVVSDADLRSAASWLHAGTTVTMWVSPRGHAGWITAEPGGS
jgi:hypothetical protein